MCEMNDWNKILIENEYRREEVMREAGKMRLISRCNLERLSRLQYEAGKIGLGLMMVLGLIAVVLLLILG